MRQLRADVGVGPVSALPEPAAGHVRPTVGTVARPWQRRMSLTRRGKQRQAVLLDALLLFYEVSPEQGSRVEERCSEPRCRAREAASQRAAKTRAQGRGADRAFDTRTRGRRGGMFFCSHNVLMSTGGICPRAQGCVPQAQRAGKRGTEGTGRAAPRWVAP